MRRLIIPTLLTLALGTSCVITDMRVMTPTPTPPAVLLLTPTPLLMATGTPAPDCLTCKEMRVTP